VGLKVLQGMDRALGWVIKNWKPISVDPIICNSLYRPGLCFPVFNEPGVALFGKLGIGNWQACCARNVGEFM